MRARGTFGRCPKSTQKDSLNLRFKNPRTLFRLRICGLLPRVRGTGWLSQRMTNCLSYCAAAADARDVRSDSVVRGGMWSCRPTKDFDIRCVGRGDHTPPRYAGGFHYTAGRFGRKPLWHEIEDFMPDFYSSSSSVSLNDGRKFSRK